MWFPLSAEREGFEPSVPQCRTTVFETAPFSRSGISPWWGRKFKTFAYTRKGLAPAACFSQPIYVIYL